jgi:hypothetical protein
MKKELLVEIAIYAACVALVSQLWHQPLALTAGAAVLSGLMLLRWHTKKDLVCYFVAFVLGPTAEAVAVDSGAWRYAEPLYLVPVWLPFLWGVVALFLKRTSETLLGSEESAR